MSSVRAALVTAILLPVAAAAAPLTDAERERYDACVAEIDTAPEAAELAAERWRRDGGGGSALHCHALALLETGDHGRAAAALEVLALRSDAGGATTRAEILAQAGNAWVLAGDGEKALNAFDNALALDPHTPAIYLDRARTLMLYEEWSNARADLDQAIRLDRGDAFAFALRARAHQALGDGLAAARDAARALSLEPGNVEAIVIQAELKQAGVIE